MHSAKRGFAYAAHSPAQSLTDPACTAQKSSPSLDANGAFRLEQNALHPRRVNLRPGTHPTQNQAFEEFDGAKTTLFRLPCQEPYSY